MASLLDDISGTLPAGYRVRAFEDADREPIVAAGNAESHPMEAESAESWRRWESVSEDRTRERVTLVAADGSVAGTAMIGAGMMARPDRAQQASVAVFRGHRNRGLGSALLAAVEAEARRRDVPRLLSQASAARPFALEWAAKRGYHEIGRRIMSYVELAQYEPARWSEALERVAREGIVLHSYADVLAERDEAGRERFWHELWEAEAPMWDDIPFAAPMPHWPFERFYAMTVKSGQLLPDASVVAYDGDAIAGFTTTGDREHRDGWTYMTGVARSHRGRGLAMALKVAALDRAKAKGLRAMCTVNDEPNKAMRGVNQKLGYQPVPDSVELEKILISPAAERAP